MMRNASDELRERLAVQERACLTTVVHVVERAIDQGITPPIDPWETAVIFWGMVTGIILLSLGGSQTVFSRRSREELIRKAIWILFEGFKHAPVMDGDEAYEFRLSPFSRGMSQKMTPVS